VTAARRPLGFSRPVLVTPAALAAPRVVVPDLGILEEGTVINGPFVGSSRGAPSTAGQGW
jgi:hypothetical protein